MAQQTTQTCDHCSKALPNIMPPADQAWISAPVTFQGITANLCSVECATGWLRTTWQALWTAELKRRAVPAG